VLKRLLSDVFVYGLSSVLARSVGLLLLPILTRYLSAAEYGVAEILAVCFVLANLLLPLEVSQAVARLFGDSRDARQREDYAWTAFWFTAAVFAALAAVVCSVPAAVSQWLLGSSDYAAVLSIAVIAMVGQALLYVIQGQLRWALQPRALAVLNLSAAAAAALSTVVFVVVLDGGLTGYMAAQAVAAYGVLPLGLWLASLKVAFRFRLKLSTLSEMLAFSWPLVLSSAAVYANGYIDRWLVQAWLGFDELGIYAAGARIASLVAIAIAGFQLAVTPLVYQHYREPGTPALLKKGFEIFLALALCAVAGIAALGPELVALMAGPAFAAAAELVGWLALGVVLMNVYLFAPGLAIAKKTPQIAAANAAAGAVNVALAVLALPLLGRLGAALAFVAGASTMSALYFFLGHRHYAVPHRLRHCLAAFAITAVYLGVVQALPLAWRLLSCAAACALIALTLIERGAQRHAPAAG
jgi:O-antigen/teichoic acid export membrane protein